MTITVTGSTFNYREILRNMGGTWDADDKSWQLPDSADINYLRKMVGVMVRQSTPEPIDSDWFQRIRDRAEAKLERFQIDTQIHGDDQSYFNYFTRSDPRAFFGFSSLSAVIKYVSDLPKYDREDNRNVGWQMSDDKTRWTGTTSMSETLDLARNGWTRGLEQAEQTRELIAGRNATRRKRKYAVAGGRVNVGRLLSGDPLHMSRRPKLPGRRNVTFFFESAVSASIDVDELIVRAGCIAAMVDVMEDHGFSCEVVSVATTGRDYQIATTLKHAGEKLNLPDLVFGLGHPSFFRRMLFGVVASDETLRDIWYGMGTPTSAFNKEHPPGPNEFYIPKLHHNDRGRIKGIREMLQYVIPDGLPVDIQIE